MSLKLGQDVRQVVIVMNTKNLELVPSFVRGLDIETEEEQRERETRADGTLEICTRTNDCSLYLFVEELQNAGYDFCDCLYQERLDFRDNRNTYHMVRLVFGYHGSTTEVVNPKFEEVKEIILQQMITLYDSAMWRVRVYNNPMHSGDDRMISVNLDARQPFYHPDGSEVKRWRKENGKNIGDAPVPISASHVLRIEGGTISLAQSEMVMEGAI